MKIITCLIIISILISGCVQPAPDKGQDGRQPPQDQNGIQKPQDQNGRQPPQNQDGRQPPQDQDGRQPPQNQDGRQPPQNQDGRQPPQGEIDIKFISLSRGESDTANIDDAKIIIADNLENASFTEWLDKATTNAINNVDFDKNVVIAVFRGKFSTRGFTITVDNVKVSGRKVKIDTKLSDPAKQVTNVISYPYDIIVLSKGDIRKGMTFELVSDNNTLASR